MDELSISIIIPAYNEEKYLPETLNSLNRAKQYLCDRGAKTTEIIVIDNSSTDQTTNIAQALGATVISELIRNIAKARNTGARIAKGNIFVFIDADTIVPETLLWRISQAISDGKCIGGAVDTGYRPIRFLLRIYLRIWRLLGKLAGMAQGATQFCRRDVFLSLGGYDETIYMGEDVDFYWRLRKAAKDQELHICFINDLQVVPSCRRFDQWPFWRTLVWTNPMVILLLRRWKKAWNGWYDAIPR